MKHRQVPDESASDLVILNEVQVLLAEKRTSLCYMRIGIVIFAFPLSVLSVLVATSHYYHTSEVLHWLILLGLLNLGLVALAIYLIVYSLKDIHRCDRLIKEIKRRHNHLTKFMDESQCCSAGQNPARPTSA